MSNNVLAEVRGRGGADGSGVVVGYLAGVDCGDHVAVEAEAEAEVAVDVGGLRVSLQPTKIANTADEAMSRPTHTPAFLHSRRWLGSLLQKVATARLKFILNYLLAIMCFSPKKLRVKTYVLKLKGRFVYRQVE